MIILSRWWHSQAAYGYWDLLLTVVALVACSLKFNDNSASYSFQYKSLATRFSYVLCTIFNVLIRRIKAKKQFILFDTLIM